MASPLPPALDQALRLSTSQMQSGNLAGAEQALMPLSMFGLSAHPEALNMLGAIRIAQGRLGEAVPLLTQGRTAAPRDPFLARNLGRALAGLGRIAEAEEAFRAAIKLQPGFAETRLDLAHLQHHHGKLEEAENGLRQLLRLTPGHVQAKLALGAVLLDAGKPVEAELPLRRGLEETADSGLKAKFHLNLSMALRRQSRDAESLAACDSAEALDAGVPGLAMHRFEILQKLGRYEEALAILRDLIARKPGDPGLHHDYNDLLYRLGRKEQFLKSYERAPRTRGLLLGQAFFLSHDKRDGEAHAIYADLLGRDPDDQVAAIGAANALSMLKRHDEAVAAFELLLKHQPDNVDIFRRAAEAALRMGDAGKAAHFCERGLALSPGDGACLAQLSIASRLLEDGRDDFLNRYDSWVQSFDLEPPEGFPDMESFNAELDASLDRLHPATREFIDQSLRGGTQTPDNLFGAGHVLVEKLKARIDQAVARYIALLPEDASHPFLSRRAKSFRYSGSWSSRLRDRGFHVNHLHPMGWISSCYYVAVPDAVKDETGRQGWIKFGEPSFEASLKVPIRRAIQPVPGRLVLFPSYMWHGTIPFHDHASRTTIAFDVVPMD